MWNFLQKLVLDLNSSCILHKACAMWASMLYSHSPPLFVLKLKVKFDFPQLASFHNGDLEGKFSKVQQSCRCDEMAVKQLFWFGGGRLMSPVNISAFLSDSLRHDFHALSPPVRSYDVFHIKQTLFCLGSLKCLPFTSFSKWKILKGFATKMHGWLQLLLYSI